MKKRWAGVTVVSEKVTVVVAEFEKSDDPLVIMSDDDWSLQNGERAQGYNVVHRRAFDFLTDQKVDRVVVKASALSRGGNKLAHLEAAELRGVVLCAAASATKVQALSKANISKTFGSRKVDDYVADDEFWKDELAGAHLRVGSREAAMLLLAARRKDEKKK